MTLVKTYYSPPLTVSEAGALGGKKRWKKTSKKQRSKAMKEVADKGWIKRHMKTVDKKLAKRSGM